MQSVDGVYEPSLDINLVRRLSAINTTRWLAAALSNWCIIVGSIAICLSLQHWLAYVTAIAVIGTRQHALGVLTHEGVHYRVASSHFWNDLISDWLSGYPLLKPTEGYRAFHLKHHRLLDTHEDPERITIDEFRREWTFPMSSLRFWWFFLRDVSGLWPKPAVALLLLTWRIPGRRLRHLVPIGMLHASIAVSMHAMDHLWTLILFWWVPLLTTFPACFRFRTSAEHSGIGAKGTRYQREVVDVISTTRTTVGSPIIRFFLAPHGINFHTEHHLYPSVPFFRLKELHEILRSDPKHAGKFHDASGYAQVVKELTRRTDATET
jgi:fatty acid desaturase